MKISPEQLEYGVAAGQSAGLPDVTASQVLAIYQAMADTRAMGEREAGIREAAQWLRDNMGGLGTTNVIGATQAMIFELLANPVSRIADAIGSQTHD